MKQTDQLMSKSNENDIESLKNRLNNLRQKLFTNFDYNDLDQDYENETNKSSDSLKNRFVLDRPPIQPKYMMSAASNQPVLLDSNNKFTSSHKSTTAKSNQPANLNIESLDLKAKQLIDKRYF